MVGVPYVVFAGNVGSDDTLAYVIDILRGADSGGCPRLARARAVAPARRSAAMTVLR
jgi:hypothetical protein